MKISTTVSLLIETIKVKKFKQTESSANIEKENQEFKTLNQKLHNENQHLKEEIKRIKRELNSFKYDEAKFSND